MEANINAVSPSVRMERIGNATLYCGDCRDILPMLTGISAIVTDPPYGTGCAPRGGKKAGTISFSSTPELEWDRFDASWLERVECAAAIFCHHGMIGEIAHIIHADATFAYVKANPSPFGTSWEACVTRGMRRTSPQHIVAYNAFNGQVHPTQKPVEVMRFVAERAPGSVICDPFMGSGTTGVACAQLNRPFIGIEIHEPYFDIACRRIEEAQRQGDLLNALPPAEDPADTRMADLFAEPEE